MKVRQLLLPPQQVEEDQSVYSTFCVNYKFWLKITKTFIKPYLHINFYSLRMQMKRNENTPYMYDHNAQNPTYGIKEGGVWGKERKKEREGNASAYLGLVYGLSSSPEGMPLGELCAFSAL